MIVGGRRVADSERGDVVHPHKKRLLYLPAFERWVVHNDLSMINDEAALDAILDVLADPTRRWLLDRLQKDGPLSVDEITTKFADSGGGPYANGRERIEASLHHVHLPKMADAGVVDWNPEMKTIDSNGNTEVAYELLAIGHQNVSRQSVHQKVSEQS